MATKRTDPTPTPGAGAQEPPAAAPLPTHGGLYEFDPATKAMRALEGGPPEEQPAQTFSETTGDAT